jgi:hypothetical protein
MVLNPYKLTLVHCGKVAGEIVCNHGAQTFTTMSRAGKAKLEISDRVKKCFGSFPISQSPYSIRLILWKQQLMQGDISQVAAVHWPWQGSGMHNTNSAPA